MPVVPNLMQAALRFADRVKTLDQPADVIALLDETCHIRDDLYVHAAWILPRDYSNADLWVLDKTCFLQKDVPAQFFHDFMAGWRKNAGNPLGVYARQSHGPFTLTEAMRQLKARGSERWIFDLFSSYGIRDGFYCPLRNWALMYRSQSVLRLSPPEACVLNGLASATTNQLGYLTARTMKQILRVPMLSPREQAVLRWLALDRPVKEITTGLGIKESTYKEIMDRARKKLGTRTRTGTVAKAISAGLL